VSDTHAKTIDMIDTTATERQVDPCTCTHDAYACSNPQCQGLLERSNRKHARKQPPPLMSGEERDDDDDEPPPLVLGGSTSDEEHGDEIEDAVWDYEEVPPLVCVDDHATNQHTSSSDDENKDERDVVDRRGQLERARLLYLHPATFSFGDVIEQWHCDNGTEFTRQIREQEFADTLQALSPVEHRKRTGSTICGARSN
jgi:hypothetical protein